MRVDIPAGMSRVELGHDVGDLVPPADHPLAAAPGPIRLVCYEWLVRVLPGVRPEILVAEFATQLMLVGGGARRRVCAAAGSGVGATPGAVARPAR